MESSNDLKKTCNIFIPRNIYSLFLILSKKKFTKNDDYILINTNKFYSQKISKDIINFLNKKNYKIILTNKPYITYKNKNLSNNFISKFLKINFFKIVNQLSNEISKINYDEFKNINFFSYNSINIYYGSMNFYFDKLCNRFKNIKLHFLEHGAGNFLSFVQNSSINKNYNKKLIINFLKSIYFKINKINITNPVFYYGICSNIFGIKRLEYVNRKIIFQRRNYKTGFEICYNFYKKKLKKIKKRKNVNYIFLNIPHHYDVKAYKNYLNYIFVKIKKKDKLVVLIKEHPGYLNNKVKYLNILLLILRKKKLSFHLINKKYDMIPIEIFIKYFKVSVIYSAYSSILFTSIYLFGEKIKLNVIFSGSIIKKYINRQDLDCYSRDFIKSRLKNKLNFIDLDKVNHNHT